jgi:hypothetical protein
MAELQKQRLERIAVQILAGLMASQGGERRFSEWARDAIQQARELMKQIDELPPIE